MDSLGSRMKGYERVSNISLTNRTPVIVRVDGRCFHSLTKIWGAEKPFDKGLTAIMHETMKVVAKDLGAVLAYRQSDEISFLLLDTKRLTTQPIFRNRLQKICSIAASATTAAFITTFLTAVAMRQSFIPNLRVARKLPNFDSRVFNLPIDEVANYFLWRCMACKRNSLFMFALTVASPSGLNGLNELQQHEILYQHGKDWERDIDPAHKNGSFYIANTKGKPFRFEVAPSFIEVDSIIREAIEGYDEDR